MAQWAERELADDIHLKIGLELMGAPSPCSSATHGRHIRTPIASYCGGLFPIKINLISCEPLAHVSDIKLIRTDTTLDLSQKAEKAFTQHYSFLSADVGLMD
ncbi:hypothetical protein PanWU01x14_118800 [Parasponia andersonii]|uniref:Uncharacterized protein n=1 Tax=Parasponia andersonii TaxID=3476 RepID=A0A2P5CVT2_PARAD|nr:hypothetical protein PanWU01x14_118800 [Parasponia andersonii]